MLLNFWPKTHGLVVMCALARCHDAKSTNCFSPNPGAHEKLALLTSLVLQRRIVYSLFGPGEQTHDAQ